KREIQELIQFSVENKQRDIFRGIRVSEMKI
ncbi:hypothetical protein scyTo_0004239, partial [Scyliorhinus torazame]|nr:hypothetical protein [Scyliorhinus torazame]